MAGPQYTLADIRQLSSWERREFRLLRGVDRILTAAEFLALINSPGPYTTATEDLLLAHQQLGLSNTRYTVDQINQLTSAQLTQLAQQLKIPPQRSSSQRLLRVLRVLRFSQQLDYTSPTEFVYPTQPILLSQIMCGHLTGQTSLTNSACTPLSSSLATNLIRVAASQIFSRPVQSFLEPVVNSIDAYATITGSGSNTGKFGLGFYSLLNWLVQDKDGISNLVLESTYADFTGRLLSWSGLITANSAGQLAISLQPLNLTEPLLRPGLKLTLTVHQSLANNLAQQIYDFLQLSLANVTTTSINLTEVSQPLLRSQQNKLFRSTRLGHGPNLIEITIARVSSFELVFTTQDYATGIDITALNYLLVPSLSSKGLVVSQYSAKVGPQTSIYENSRQPGLLILVGEILVKLVDFGLTTKPDGSKITTKFVLQLSAQTQLPVSRDDIIFNPTVTAEFELNVWYLLQQALVQQPGFYVMLLLKALQNYALARYLVSPVSQRLNQGGYLLVPYQYYSVYRDVFADHLNGQLVGYDDTLAVSTEEALLKAKPGRSDIFLTKTVYVTKALSSAIGSSTAGSSRLLFLTPNQDGGWADLVLLYQDQGLIPLGQQWFSQSSKEAVINYYLNDFVDMADYRVRPIVATIFTKMVGLTVNYDLSAIRSFHIYTVPEQFHHGAPALIADFTQHYAHSLLTLGEPMRRTFQVVLGTYLKFLSSLKPQVDYGSAQKVLSYELDSALPSAIRDPVRFQRYYSELIAELAPRAAAKDTWMLGSHKISFQCFSSAPEHSYYSLTETLAEFVYLTLLQNCVSYYLGSDQSTDCNTAATVGLITNFGQFQTSSRNYPALFGSFLGPDGQRNRARATALLNYWRNHLNSPDRREQLYDYLATIQLKSFDLAYTLPSIYKASEVFLQVYEANQQLVKTPLALILNTYEPSNRYPLSQLIQFVFQNPVKAADFLQFSRTIPNQAGNLPIQILEIAINEGTTKAALQAMLIETAQNAFDAVKAAGLINAINSATIKINLAQAGQQLSYQIIDPVGISPAGLLSLSIPFLTTKGPSQGQESDLAGEMGSGFFNVYRAAQVVNIVTVRNGFYTVIVDTPVRSGGRVTDVNRVMSTSKTRQRNGTTITVLINSSQPSEDLSQLLVLTQTWLAAAATAAGLKLVLNGREVNLNSQICYTSPVLQLSLTTSPIESVVLTKGSPLSSLTDWLAKLAGSTTWIDSIAEPLVNPFKVTIEINNLGQLFGYLADYINTNLIINLVGDYRPTQGRTDIILSDRDSLIRELLSGFYQYILNLQLQQPDQSYVANFASTAAVSQVLPWWTSQPIRPEYHSVEEFLWYFRPVGSEWPKGLDLASAVNKLAAIMTEPDYNPAEPVSLQVSQATTFGQPVEPIILQVAQAWLSKKNLTVSKAPVVLEVPQLKGSGSATTKTSGSGARSSRGTNKSNSANPNTITSTDRAVLNLANKFVQAYWARLPPQYRTGPAPQVKLAILDGALATYQAANNQILLSNSVKSSPPKVLTYDSLLDYFQNAGFRLFGKRNPPAVFVHELEHAWRQSSHSGDKQGDSAHSEIQLNLPGLTATNKTYSFDQAANLMYDYVLKAGLMTALVESV